MKTKSIIAALPLFVLFAFAPGGDSYKVYLGDRVLTEQYVHSQKSIPALTVDAASKERLVVQFSHCGLQGKTRSVSLRGENDKVLKEWSFVDNAPMEIMVPDIAVLHVGKLPMNLYYTSREIPMGRHLASLALTGTPVVANR